MKLSSMPHLVNEWHPTKNGELTPDDFTHATRRKVWWLCPMDHSNKSIIQGRTRRNPLGCPYCSGRKTLNYDLFKL